MSDWWWAVRVGSGLFLCQLVVGWHTVMGIGGRMGEEDGEGQKDSLLS